MEIRYWFPKWRVICKFNKESGLYHVCNGGWSFYVRSDNRRYFEHTKKLVDNTTDKPVRVTKQEFDKLVPGFGYW